MDDAVHQQTNRWNGEATVKIMSGQLPDPASLIPLNSGGTPNQMVEAAAARVGTFCYLSSNPSLGDPAVLRSIELLQKQLHEGHMWIEALTDSHAPIWLRGMTSLRWYSMHLRSKGGQFIVLDDLVQQWFEHHLSVLQLGLVPSGKLAGTVVLPCARKTPGVAGDRSRDAWVQLVTTCRVSLSGLGPNFMKLSQDRQDTACGPITAKVLAAGGFGDNFKRGTLPKLLTPLEIERFPEGHTASFPKGLAGCSDAATDCWVSYSSGMYAFTPGHGPFAGRIGQGRRAVIEGIAA
jgi:hypothetical protein